MDYKEMCVKQGYVPSTCKMDGQMCWLLVKDGKDPCNGCNHDRYECKGRYDDTVYIPTATIFDEIKEERYNRINNHAVYATGVIMSVETDIGHKGKPQIQIKVSNLVSGDGYTIAFDEPDIAANYIPDIIVKYKVNQIFCEINGFGMAVYEKIKNITHVIDVVPIRYRRMDLS